MTLYTTTGTRGYEEAYLLNPCYLQNYPVLGALVSIPVALAAGVLAIKQAVSSLFYRAATCPRQKFVNEAWQGREITLICDAKELGSICLANIINVCTLGVFNLISANRARAQRQNAPIEPGMNAAYADIAPEIQSSCLKEQTVVDHLVPELLSITELQNWVVFFENSLTIEELRWIQEGNDMNAIYSFIIGTIIITYAFGERKNELLPQSFFNKLITIENRQATTKDFITILSKEEGNAQCAAMGRRLTVGLYTHLNSSRKEIFMTAHVSDISSIASQEVQKMNAALAELVHTIQEQVKISLLEQPLNSYLSIEPLTIDELYWISFFIKNLTPNELAWIQQNENFKIQQSFIIAIIIANYAFGEKKLELIPEDLFINTCTLPGDELKSVYNFIIEYQQDNNPDITVIINELCDFFITSPSTAPTDLKEQAQCVVNLAGWEIYGTLSPQLNSLVSVINEQIQNNPLLGP